MSKKLDLDSFAEVIDGFLKDNTIQMLLTIPEGTLDVQVRDNTGLGAVVQFYILLQSIRPVSAVILELMKIDNTSPEWRNVVDSLLGLVRNELMKGQRPGHCGL